MGPGSSALSRLARDRWIGGPDVSSNPAIVLKGSFAELDGEQFVPLVGRAEFKGEVVEKLAFVDRDDYLTLVLSGQHADKSGELSDMHLVHRLDRIIEDETGDHGIHGEVKSEKER